MVAKSECINELIDETKHAMADYLFSILPQGANIKNMINTNTYSHLLC